MFLYAAHDNTVFYLLNALEVLIPHAPEYTACVMVEVHKINNVDSIRILYRSLTDLKILIVPGCSEFCPLKKFIQLVEKNIPTDEFCNSHKSCC
ncbi:hypothetical protein FQR65_LT09653 [Abscondita terminalis]|nr:hypothetical protein FQR65_LT09653 [Abscondita terminalis]